MLSPSPREAHFVRCVAVVFSVMDSLNGREAFTSYHVLRMTASDRFSNDLVSLLLRYLSALQQLFLLMVAAHSVDIIVTKHIAHLWLSVRLFDTTVE
jgi:hypothetical protein